MSKSILTFLLGICLVMSSSIYGADQIFSARIDNSKWEATANSLKCELQHTVPGFGSGIFYQFAGRPPEFILKSDQRLKSFKIEILAYSPDWYRSQKPKTLVKVASKSGFIPVHFNKSTPDDMLRYLAEGQHIQFAFHNTKKVILSPYGFNTAYQSYLSCLADLVPYTYEQIKATKVRFNSGSLALIEQDKEKLAAIADTIMNDPEITRVHITGHSDTKGNYRQNRDLALKRMWAVKDFLVFHGVDPKIITQKGHADAKPIATNKTAEGRAKNRRVEVTLYR